MTTEFTPWFRVRGYTRLVDYTDVPRDAIVREIQRMVSVPADGVFGPQTKSAAVDWMRRQPMRVTGDEASDLLMQARSLEGAQPGQRIPIDAWYVLAPSAMVRLGFPLERMNDLELIQDAIPMIAAVQPRPSTTPPAEPRPAPGTAAPPVVSPTPREPSTWVQPVQEEPRPRIIFGTPTTTTSEPTPAGTSVSFVLTPTPATPASPAAADRSPGVGLGSAANSLASIAQGAWPYALGAALVLGIAGGGYYLYTRDRV